MSHAATNWAFDQPRRFPDMKPSEWAVLMVLANCHNPVYGCYPSQEYICEQTNLGERSVRDQLGKLRERKLIDWDEARANGRRGSNRYKLAFESDYLPAKSAGSATGKIEREQPADSDSSNRQNLPPNPVREPVKDPVSEMRARPSVRRELADVLDDEHVEAVIEHRKAMRKPLTVHAAKLLARKLALMPDPNCAADAMIGNGWQGFEPQWLENRTAPRGGIGPPGRRTLTDAARDLHFPETDHAPDTTRPTRDSEYSLGFERLPAIGQRRS